MIPGFRLRDRDGPRRFARLMERLGPTTTKIGQYLALRPDLLPPAYCDELLSLVDHARPFDWPDVCRVVEAELGRPPDALFIRFERAPFAAGSLAQVHRARTPEGEEVVVKVQRPDMEARIARDLRRLRRIAGVLTRINLHLPVSATDIVDEVEQWLTQEVDFAHELDNAGRLWRLAAGSAIHVVPRAYPALSSRRVLTYDHLEGKALSTILEDVRRRRRSEDPGDPPMPDEGLRRFAGNLVRASLTQMFRHHFFHADLHPGNLLVLPDDRVGFLDFGLCDTLDATVRANQLRYVAAIHDEDRAGMFRALTEILSATPTSDYEGLARDFDVQARRLSAAEGMRATGYLIDMIGVARRNGFLIPPQVLSLSRTLLMLETLTSELGMPGILRRVGGDFFLDLRRDEWLEGIFEREKLGRTMMGLLDLTREGPVQLARVLSDAAEGNMRLKVEVSDTARMVASANRRARLWAAAILSVSVSVLLTIPEPPAVFGISLAWPLGVVLAGLYLTCAVLWRRL